MPRRGLGLVLVALLHGDLAGQTPLPVPLAPGSLVERDLAPGQSHTYDVTLTAGQFLHVTIEQRGIDVVAALVAPDGRERASADSTQDDFLVETLVAVADSTGPHRVIVASAATAALAGRYAIRLDAARAATPRDEIRIRAEQIYLRARQARTGPAKERARAADDLQHAVAAYRELGDDRGALKTLIEIAWLENTLARPSAYAAARQAMDLARSVADPKLTALAHGGLGQAHQRRGEMADALRSIEEGIRISRALGDRKMEAVGLNDMGVVYGRTGEGEKALNAFHRALALARLTNLRTTERGALNNLGVTYKNLREFERSLEAYNAVLPLIRAAGDARAEALTLNNMGNLLRLLQEPQKALDAHLRALELSRQGGATEDEARSLNTIGLTYYGLEEFDRALDHHRQSLAIRRRIQDLAGIGASLYGEGRTLHRLGRHDEAMVPLGEALTIRRRIREQYGEPEILQTMAAVERARGNITAALAHIEAAVDLNETLRQRITSPELRAFFQSGAADEYELFIDLLQQRHLASGSAADAAAALHVSERARARVLLDSLLDARVDLREGVEPALLERQRSLQKQLNDASGRLSRALATGSGGTQSAAAEVDRLTGEYQDLETQIRRRNPRYASITLPQPLTAAEIQARVVDSDTVLLEFALGQERSWLWTVTPDATAAVSLPPRATIEKAVRSLYETVTARQRHAGEKATAYAGRIRAADARLVQERSALREMLLGPIAARLRGDWRGRRLAIVATGVLEYVPFAALVPPDEHEIAHVPSASVLAALRQETAGRPRAPRAIAVLADPVFEVTDPRVAALLQPRATSGKGRALARAGRTTRSDELGTLIRLPFSREEAAAIVSLAARGDVFTATDFKASRATVMGGALAGHRVVHFATHGVFDASSPALSGLVLSLVDERGAPQDGFLRLNDIYNMRLDADLVVLSACRTALGREFKGEGLVGLARAFMYAGAPRVVASLWQVSDFATAELMKKFYRGVLTGRLRPAAALRAAQLEMSRDPRWASPYYWAGFVLQGEWK